MNSLNEQRAQIVTEQLFDLRPDNTTPTNDFNVSPEYTLIAHLPEGINNSINAIVNELKIRFPEHYYYAPSQYHLTVVPIPHSMDPTQITEVIAPVLSGWRLPIRVRGVVANRLQAGVVLYPEEETLIPQRLKLRAALGIPEQAYTAHNPVWEELLWSNFMRFTTKPEEELLTFLRAHVDHDLGKFVLSRYELYEVSTKTLDPASSKLLHTFDA
jgi:hypothetical protein